MPYRPLARIGSTATRRPLYSEWSYARGRDEEEEEEEEEEEGFRDAVARGASKARLSALLNPRAPP